MDFEFDSIWHALGWENFVPVWEIGSRPLTIQFLCTLWEDETGIMFHFHGTSYRVSWHDLSCALGFIQDSFWEEISGRPVRGKLAPRCNDILHPTL